jgi:stage II sporulation protein D
MDSSPNIHIGILKAKEIEFSLEGKFEISGTSQNCYGSCVATNQKGLIVINNAGKKLSFEKEVIFLPCNLSADKFEINNVKIGIDFHWEQKENQIFQGALKLMCIDGDVQVINICPIENYLYSVISSEMNADASLQLLKSHAVISRSWLMAQMEKPVSKKSSETQESEGEYIRWFDREDHKHFHVCADDHCQRYQGITRAHNKNVVLAVNETMGEVLKYKGSICDARYSKACGGVTELFENCWEDVPHPYLQRVVDRPASDQYKDTDLKIEENAETFIKIEPEAFCNTKDEKVLRQVLNDYDLESKDFYRWKVKYSQKELSALIKERSDIDFGDILDLVPIQRGESGRIIRLQIIGTKRILTIGKELIIRRWLSKSHLYSSAFLVERENENEGIPEGFIFYGAGWGHGVGLCQIGAALMGEKGYSYKEILEHYYKNAKIEKAYS